MIARSSLILALTLLGTAGGTARAQRLSSDFRSFQAAPLQPSKLFPATPKPTYWLEGGIIGGAALGAAFAYEAGRWCECTSGERVRATIGVGLFAAGLGFTVGTLIGGQFPKQE